MRLNKPSARVVLWLFAAFGVGTCVLATQHCATTIPVHGHQVTVTVTVDDGGSPCPLQ